MNFFNSRQYLYSPINGTSIPLDTVRDPLFKNEMMGKTLTFHSDDHVVYSPIAGKVAALYPSNHAVGIEGKCGLEILLHIGVDTCKLNGKGFESYVSVGDSVKPHTPLLHFDEAYIQSHGYTSEVMLIILNEAKNNFDFSEISKTHLVKEDQIGYVKKI